jgi:hypothetical protein
MEVSMSPVAEKLVTPLRTFGLETTIKVTVRDYDPAVAEKACYGEDWGIANPKVIEWKAALWQKLKARTADFQKFIDIVVSHYHVAVYFENAVAEWGIPKSMEAFMTSIHELPEDLTDEYDHFFSNSCLLDIIACVNIEYVSVACTGRGVAGAQERAELDTIPSDVRKEMDSALTDEEGDSYWNRLSPSDAVFQNQYEILTSMNFGVGGRAGAHAHAEAFQLMRKALSVSPGAQDILFGSALRSAFEDDCLMDWLPWGEPMESILFRAFICPKRLSTRQEDEWEEGEENAWQRRALALMLPAIAALPEKERIVVVAAIDEDLTEVFRLAIVSAETTLRRDGAEIVPVVEPEDANEEE